MLRPKAQREPRLAKTDMSAALRGVSRANLMRRSFSEDVKPLGGGGLYTFKSERKPPGKREPVAAELAFEFMSERGPAPAQRPATRQRTRDVPALYRQMRRVQSAGDIALQIGSGLDDPRVETGSRRPTSRAQGRLAPLKRAATPATLGFESSLPSIKGFSRRHAESPAVDPPISVVAK